MKRTILSLCALLLCSHAFAAVITLIDGPSSPCPNKQLIYRIDFAMLSGPGISEVVNKVIWEFSQNGTVVYSKTVAIAATGILGTSSITVPGLHAGQVKIKVKIEYLTVAIAATVPGAATKTKDIFVGVPDATEIIGDVICPGASGVFSISALANATSYTWEVPAGWKVNGITGPVVASQGTSVTIRPCSDTTCRPTAFSAFTIKVKGVSTTCGQSNYFSKTIKIDHPIRITETNFPYNDVKLSASPTNFPSYQWTLDPAWYFPANGNKNLPEVSFNSRGLTGLATLTYTTPCQNTYTRTWWWVLPNTGGPGSPGNPGDPQPDPGDCDPEIPASYLPSAKAMNMIYIKAPCDQEPPAVALYSSDTGSLKPVTLVRNLEGFEYDISSLKPGMYILQLKTAKGKHKTMKFIKLD